MPAPTCNFLLRLGFLFLLACLALPLQSPAQQQKAGDLDDDGIATVYDLTRLISHLNGSQQLLPSSLLYADLDEDGDVDQIDAQLLRDAVLLRFELPVPQLSYLLSDFPDTVSDSLFSLDGASLPGKTILVEGGKTPQTTESAEDGSFSLDVPLKENQVNRLFVTIFDEDGNASPPRAIHVTHDTQAPNLYIDFPGNNSEVFTDKTEIAGRVGDTLSGYRGLDVRVNGEPAAVIVGIGQNGTFERGSVPLDVGKNVITVSATDALGNTVSRVANIYRRVPVGPLIEVLSGNNQEGPVDGILSQAATVRVRYPNGTPIAGKLVNFKVIKSNGMLSDQPELASFIGSGLTYQATTNSEGIAKVYWRMGHDAGCGNNRLQATSKDVSGVAYFCASANPESPSQINIGSGNNQRAAVNSVAVEPLRVWVNDSCNGVEDIPVTFRVIAGDGKVDGGVEAVALTTRTGHAGVEFKLGPRQGNNVIEADFDGNPNAPARFIVFGMEAQASGTTSWEGIIFDNANKPIGGARCQLEIGGVFQDPVYSDESGVFKMDNLPSGSGYLHIEGLVANSVGGEEVPAGSFPSLHYQVLVVEGAANSLGEPVLLPPLDPVNAREFDNSKDLVLTCEGIEGLKMTIKAGSMRLPDGTKPDWRNPTIVSLNQVHHDDAPMPMPDGVSPPFAWTLQPSGATFSTPVQIEYPNMKGLAPGAVAYFLSYDHDQEEFVIAASGHVTDDGSTIVTDPEVGLTKAGWGCNCPPYSVTADCENCAFECVSPGKLIGGKVTKTNEIVCEGQTIEFIASEVMHVEGAIIERCPDSPDKTISIAVNPEYSWTITSPTLDSPLMGTGNIAIVSDAVAGKYTCKFEATVKFPENSSGNCMPIKKTLPESIAYSVRANFTNTLERNLELKGEDKYSDYKKTLALEWKPEGFQATSSVDLEDYIKVEPAEVPQEKLRDFLEIKIEKQIFGFGSTDGTTLLVPNLDPDDVNIYSFAIQLICSEIDSAPIKHFDNLIVVIYSKESKEEYSSWKSSNPDNPTWLSELPPVYSKLGKNNGDPEPGSPNEWDSQESAPKYYHFDAKYEMRSIRTKGRHGHQACYDGNGNLIEPTGTSKTLAGAGSADFGYWGNILPPLHLTNDVRPFIRAAQLDGNPVEGSTSYTSLTHPLIRIGPNLEEYFKKRPAHTATKADEDK